MDWSKLSHGDAPQSVHKQFSVEVAAEEDRKVKFTITTTTPDRERDVVDSLGVDVSAFERNPVVLFGHDYHSLPVGRAVSLEKSDSKIVSTVEFATADMNPLAEQVYRMVKAGFLRAVSIGFHPTKWVYNEDRRGVDFMEVELLEYSVVPVPANAEALVGAAAKGINTQVLKEWAMDTLAAVRTAELSEVNDDQGQQLGLGDDPESLGDDKLPDIEVELSAGSDVETKVGDAEDNVEEVKQAADVVIEPPVNSEKRTASVPAVDPDVDSSVSTRILDDSTKGKKAEIPLALLYELRDEVASMQKRGRVLSKSNESKIRRAMESSAKVSEELGAVLAEVQDTATEEDSADHVWDVSKLVGLERPESVITRADLATISKDAGAAAQGADEYSVIFDDEDSSEPVYELDPEIVMSAVRDGLAELIGEQTREAVDALSGRVT